MARKVGYFSSGIYDRETDLSVVTQAIGTFAGGSIMTSEKGPAFEIIPSSTFSERTEWFGNLNPKYPGSYFAKQYLEQASNYKEIRLLGLEGYKDTKAFAIAYDMAGVTAATVDGHNVVTSPFEAGAKSIAAILKPRRGLSKEVVTITIQDYTDPQTNVVSCTENKFVLHVLYDDDSTIDVVCSLRPESREYLPKLFGTDPKSKNKLFGVTVPVWVDFIIPSVERKNQAVTSITAPKAYYYPGDDVPLPALDIKTGVCNIDTDFLYAALTVASISNATPIVVGTTGAHNLSTGETVVITGVTGNTAANGVWYISVVNSTSFELFSDAGLTVPAVGNGAWTGSSGTIRRNYVPTWEKELLDFEDTAYQIPVTPWFVSNIDSNGEFKRLFRLWTISDGESANTEIKVEIANINPNANGGTGTFDIFVKPFNSTEDGQRQILEAWTDLSMDPTNDNYIFKQIGDGNDEELHSKYMLIEMQDQYDAEVLASELPYGCEGYPNTTGIVMEDLEWTTEYNLSQNFARQTLGLANNNVNMFRAVVPNQLSYRNVFTSSNYVGKGFHLNELADTALFAVAPVDILTQLDSNNNPKEQFTGDAQTDKARLKYVVCFYGGFDGWNVYADRTWGDSNSKDYEALQQAVEIFNDRESLFADITVLVTPDINVDEHEAAVRLVNEMCAARQDVLQLVDLKYDADVVIQSAASSIETCSVRNSFAASYYPHVQFKDVVNRVNLWVPPSVMALSTIANVDSTAGVGQPPAGSIYTVTNDIIRPRRRIRVEERDILKKAGINSITVFPGTGMEITESRTMQTYFSSLSFIHNRLILNYAKKTLNQLLHPLLHQLNNEITAQALVNAVQPVFDRLKKKYRIADFKIIAENSNDNRVTLYGTIKLTMYYPVERIVMDYVLKDNNFIFNQIG